MGKNSNLPNQILDPTIQAIYQTNHLSKWSSIIQEMNLASLIELKLQTVSKIKSLVGILTTNDSLPYDKQRELISKVEAHQYNLTIFKQLNAIANAGSPTENMFGINACIYRAGDLKTLSAILHKLKISNLDKRSEKAAEFKAMLDDKIKSNKEISTSLYKMQTDYNKNMKVKVEYLVIT